MAKFYFKDALGDFNMLRLQYGDLHSTTTSATRYVLEDSFGMKVTCFGSGLSYNKNDEPTAGTITKIEFRNADGALLTQVTNAGFNAKGFSPAEFAGSFVIMQNGNDTYNGSSMADIIFDGLDRGDDIVFGNGGDDYILGSRGNNTINGGAGLDTINYDRASDDPANATKGVILDAVKGTARNPWGGTDKIISIETYYGSFRADTLRGDGSGEEFDGVEGNDKMTGRGGADTFIFSAMGTKNFDTITDFGNGADVIRLLQHVGINDYTDIQPLMTEINGNVVITFDADNKLTLLDITEAELDASDFLFA